MKVLYLIRVAFISFEMLILLTGAAVLLNFSVEATALAKVLDINPEIVKFLIILPLSVFVWIVKESKELMFSEKENTKQLVNWPDFWQLKAHIYISFLFSVVFCVIAVVPWLSKSGISDGKGLILFSCGVLGCLWVAASTYFAQMTVKEIFNLDYATTEQEKFSK